MPAKININKLINDREALKKTSWSTLHKFHEQFPFSNIVTVLMAKKQFLESGNMDTVNFETALAQRNNPGISFLNLTRWEKPKQVRKKKSNAKRKNEPTGKKPLKRKLKPVKKLREKKEKMRFVKSKYTFMEDLEISSDFTRWLLDKDAGIGRSNRKPEKTKIGDAKSISDKSSLLKDEIISESLARVYAKQGLINEALEMYRKLSLKNPKKSSYFAAIIENLKKN